MPIKQLTGAASDEADPGTPRPAPQTLTVEQAARRLGISRSTAYECVRNGSLPSLRFRRRIVIPAVIIDRLLDGMNGAELETANPSAH